MTYFEVRRSGFGFSTIKPVLHGQTFVDRDRRDHRVVVEVPLTNKLGDWGYLFSNASGNNDRALLYLTYRESRVVLRYLRDPRKGGDMDKNYNKVQTILARRFKRIESAVNIHR